MTINSPQAFVASLWDWACLDGCFGSTNIKPTDCDGLVERNGWFLLLEAKLPGVEIPCGQERMFEALVATQHFTVLIIWGHPGTPVAMRLLTRHGAREYEGASIETLRNVVSQWFNWANGPY